jgi:hypothetical protein
MATAAAGEQQQQHQLMSLASVAVLQVCLTTFSETGSLFALQYSALH